MTIEVAKRLFLNKKLHKKIESYLLQRFSKYVQLFYEPGFADEFIEKAKEIKRINRKNWWKALFNKQVLDTANALLNTSISVCTAIIRDSVSSIPLSEVPIIDFLKELDLTQIKYIPFNDAQTLSKENYIKIITDLSKIGKAIGFDSVIILFDKLDEFQELQGDISKIASFCREILTDTDLLLDSNIAVVFSLWSELKREACVLGARFDKFGEISVTLENDELIKLLNKRLLYFAKDKNNPPTFDSLIELEAQRSDIIDIAAQSPRTLITLLGHIYNRQQDKSSSHFTPNIINKAIITYCRSFDFLSLHPYANNRQDLSQWINKLLKVGKPEFIAGELQKALGLKGKTIINYIKTLIEYDLIRDSRIYENENDSYYVVIEPRIVYLMRHNIVDLN